MQISTLQKRVRHGRRVNVQMVILGGILAIIFLLLFTDTSGAYGRIVSGLISQSLRKQGWAFDIRNASLMGLSLNGDSIVTRWENGPLFQMMKPSISVDFLPLFKTSVRGHFSGNLYEGPVELDFSHGLISQGETLEGTLQNIHLNLVPFLRNYGVHDGVASVLFKGIKLEDSLPVAGSFSFSVSEFKRSKDQVTSTSPQARELRLVNFALDAVAANLEISKLETTAIFKQDLIEIETITLSSSLGSAIGAGTIADLQTNPSVEIGLHIILSDKGQQIIGPLLSLVPGFPKLTEADLKKVEAQLSGPLSKPRWSFIPSKQ